MAKYRRLEYVDAVPVNDLIESATHNWLGLPKWIVDMYERGDIVFGAHHIFIGGETGMNAGRGDWIIHDNAGRVYSCASATFTAVFELAEASS